MIPKVAPHLKIDKSGLMLGVPNRIRSPKHLTWIRTLRCVVPGCPHRLVQVHHLLHCPDAKARSEKAGDNWTVPLCVFHHHELHHMGDETRWVVRHWIDLVAIAAEFWRRSPANRRV